MPTLVQNYRKKEVATKLSKFYTVMNQAINLSTVNNGELKNWNLDCGPVGASTCTFEEIENWFKEYLGKYLQVSKIEVKSIPTVKSTDSPKDVLLVYLNDGSILRIPEHVFDMSLYLSPKGLFNPQYGQNVFLFKFGQQGNFEPYTYEWDGTLETLVQNRNNYGCAQIGYHCTKLIQVSGWEIPDNYPYKF